MRLKRLISPFFADLEGPVEACLIAPNSAWKWRLRSEERKKLKHEVVG